MSHHNQDEFFNAQSDMPADDNAVQPHSRCDGTFVVANRLCTRSVATGASVYGEKRVNGVVIGETETCEFRVWNPYRSKLASAIYSGVESIRMQPGSTVLYLGAASGTTVSHVSDLVGPEGVVYAVEFSTSCVSDLLGLAKPHTNIVPILEDARHPNKYETMVPNKVDCIVIDVAQPDQARILAVNAEKFLRSGGGFVSVVDATEIDTTVSSMKVFAAEVAKMKDLGLKPKEQVTLEPYHSSDHAVITGIYKP